MTENKTNILVSAAPKELLPNTLAYVPFLVLVLYPLSYLKYETLWCKETQSRRTALISAPHSFIESLPCTRISFCAPEMTTRWTPAASWWTRGPIIQTRFIHCCSLTLLEGCLLAPCCDGFDMNSTLFITTLSLWYVFILVNVTDNVMSSWRNLYYDAHRKDYSANVGQTSKCLDMLI